MISSIINDEPSVENEASMRYLDRIKNDAARSDIKSEVKTFANNFHKKCSNKNLSIDALIQEYGTFKDAIKKRIQTHSIYRGKNKNVLNDHRWKISSDESEELIPRVRDYLERIIFTRDYSLIFNRIASSSEEKDLSIQNRISSLHWITAPMLDTVLNENIPAAHEAIYKAINGRLITLMFMRISSFI